MYLGKEQTSGSEEIEKSSWKENMSGMFKEQQGSQCDLNTITNVKSNRKWGHRGKEDQTV